MAAHSVSQAHLRAVCSRYTRRSAIWVPVHALLPLTCSFATVYFRTIFDAYVHISDKVVGMLLRCRKHGIVFFEGIQPPGTASHPPSPRSHALALHFAGETLLQTRDDEVPILMLFSASRAREHLAERGLKSGAVAGGASAPVKT